MGFFVGFLVGAGVGFFVDGCAVGAEVGFFVVKVGFIVGLYVVGLVLGDFVIVGLAVGGTLYVTPSASGHSVGSGLIPVYALLTYSSRFITLSYMLSQATTPLESMT